MTELRTAKYVVNRKTFSHYTGSLDFPCDFCESNSYDNYHFKERGQLKLVICKACLLKLISMEGEDG